jgi:[ribosomal protein S18]-alanine N-acetyltransferase
MGTRNIQTFRVNGVSERLIQQFVRLDKKGDGRPWNTEGWRSESRRLDTRMILAFVDNELVGLALYRMDPFVESLHLFKIIVNYHQRCKGIGKAMMRTFLEYASVLNVYNVILDVEKTNLAAIGLYKSFDFKVLVDRPSYYSNGHASFLMELKL